MDNTTNEPVFETQLNEEGIVEKIDTTIYCIRLICSVPGCFGVRYVKSQDRTIAKMCKPHARKARLESRAQRARDKRKRDRDIPD